MCLATGDHLKDEILSSGGEESGTSLLVSPATEGGGWRGWYIQGEEIQNIEIGVKQRVMNLEVIGMLWTVEQLENIEQTTFLNEH